MLGSETPVIPYGIDDFAWHGLVGQGVGLDSDRIIPLGGKINLRGGSGLGNC